MTRTSHILAWAVLAFASTTSTASAQFPFTNPFAPFFARPAAQPQIRPAVQQVPVQAGWNNRNQTICQNGVCYPANNQYQTNRVQPANCVNGVCQPANCPNGFCGTVPPANSNWNQPVNYQINPGYTQPITQPNTSSPYFNTVPVNQQFPVNQQWQNDCRPDALGRCTNPNHPAHQVNPGWNGAVPNQLWQPNNINLNNNNNYYYETRYRQQEFLPWSGTNPQPLNQNWNQPVQFPANDYYLGQLR